MPQSLDPNQFDKSTFTNEGYVKRVEKPWGYEVHWVPEGLPYMGKIEHVNKGATISAELRPLGDMLKRLPEPTLQCCMKLLIHRRAHYFELLVIIFLH